MLFRSIPSVIYTSLKSLGVVIYMVSKFVIFPSVSRFSIGNYFQTYIAMSPEMLQQLNLTQRTLRKDLLAENIGDLLDRNLCALSWNISGWVVWKVWVHIVL